MQSKYIYSTLYFIISCAFVFAQTVEDINGNVYKTVTIGSQVWMAENLRATSYNDGQNILRVTESNEWDNLTKGAYCWYNNDINNSESYGALYNWFAVNTDKICPEGWAVPSSVEWDTLINYLGGNFLAGGLLKEEGTTHWRAPNMGATNKFKFNALPAGVRVSYISFSNFGNNTYYWSSTQYGKDKAWSTVMTYFNSTMYSDNNKVNNGFSIRCLKK